MGNVASFVTVTVPAQLSLAVGAVRLVTSQSAVTSGRGSTSGTGSVISFMTTFWVCVDKFPAKSVKVHVTKVVPWVLIGNEASCVPATDPSQLSVAVGAVSEVTSHSAVISASVAASGTGASASVTTTSNSQTAGPLFDSSVYSYLTVVVPTGNSEPVASPVINSPGIPVPMALSSKTGSV